MTYSIDTTILGPSLGNPDHIYDWAVAKGCKRPGEVRRYLDTVYAVAPRVGIRAELVVTQSIHETMVNGVPWASSWWTNRLNPTGAGVTGDPKQDAASPYFADGEAAAYYQITHLWLYAVGTALPTGLSSTSDPRWQAALDEDYEGTATTLDGLTNRWAKDSFYADKIAARLNTFSAAGLFSGGVQLPKDPQLPTYTTSIPGLPGGPLVTDYPINTSNMIPASRTYQRPGIKAALPRRSVQHGTGNPKSMAAGENNWLVNQQAGGGQVSFHFVADDKGVYQNVPVDEVTWQAADSGGPGNMNGYSCEQIENSAMWADTARALRCIAITADLMGRIAARLNVAIAEQHWTFNYALPPSQRHDCPEKLRYRYINGRLAWDIYDEQWKAAKADELKRMAGDGTGGPVEPTPVPVTYAKPVPIPELANVTMDMHDTVDGIVSRDGGDDFIFVADVVEATQETPRLQYANLANSPAVGPDLEPGERFIVTWLVKAGDGEWYYVTPYWTRIYRKHTKRIADAPVLVAAAGQE